MKSSIYSIALIFVILFSCDTLSAQSSFGVIEPSGKVLKTDKDFTSKRYNDSYIIEDGQMFYITDHLGVQQLLILDSKFNFQRIFTDSFTVTFMFDQPNARFFLVNDSLLISNRFIGGQVTQINDTTFQFYPPSGFYNLMIEFPGTPRKFVFRESLNFTSDTTMHFSVMEATHRISFNGLDENGNPLAQLSGSKPNFSIIIPNKYSLSISQFEDHILVSDMTGWVIFSGQHFSLSRGIIDRIHSVRFPIIEELYQDTTLTNDPSDFLIQNLRLEYPPVSTERFISIWSTSRISPYGGFSGSGSGYEITSTKWNGKLYINSEPDENYVHSVRISAEVDGQSFDEYIEFPSYRRFDNQIGAFIGLRPSPITYLSSTNDTLVYGLAPIFPNGIHLNNLDNQNQIGIYTNFYGSLNEARNYDEFQSQLTILDSLNNVIFSGVLNDFDALNVDTGTYHTRITNNYYWVNGIRGVGTLDAQFDLQSDDVNPPVLTSLRILNSERKPKDRIRSDEKAIIQFSAADFFAADTIRNGQLRNHLKYRRVLTDSTHLYIKKHNTTDWLEIPINEVMEDSSQFLIEWVSSVQLRKGFQDFPAGKIYQAGLNMIQDWEDVGLDLRIRVMDQTGNSLQWSLEPACFVFHRKTTAIRGQSETMIKTFSLEQNYPNPFNPSTIFSYTLPVTSDIELNLYNMKGQKVKTLYSGRKTAGVHTYKLNAENLSSGIYFYQLNTDHLKITKKCVIVK